MSKCLRKPYVAQKQLTIHSKGNIMECVIGYVKILCAGTAARSARLKFENCDLTMMLSTNCYKNYSRVFSMPFLTSVEASKRYSSQIRRY